MNRQMAKKGRAAIFLAIGLLLGAGPVRGQDKAAGSQTSSTAMLYQAKCAICHGEDGNGETPAGKALGAGDQRSEAIQKMTDAQMTDIIANGKGHMQAWKNKLTAKQIKELVAYIRTLANKKP